MQCIEYFQQLETEGKGWELEAQTRDELENIESGKGSTSLYAKRTIILNNLYGVDIDEGAVEICKLRLWLSMVADIEDEPSEVEPLPNIDFNIRQGNSLIGFTDIQEVARQEQGDASLANYGAVSGVKELYEDIIKEAQRHRAAGSAKEATNARNVAEAKIKSHSQKLTEKLHDKLTQTGLESIATDDLEQYDPFHWVLEFAIVYESGGFDVVIGNPPWEELKPYRDDFFPKYDPAFRTRTSSEKDDVMDELLEDSEVAKEWEGYRENIEKVTSLINRSPDYKLQSPKVENQNVGTANDLSLLFGERVFDIVREGGYVSQVLPGAIFNAAAGKDLRVFMLENAEVEHIIGFENKGIFSQIHNQYSFGILTLRNSGETTRVRGIFNQTSLHVLQKFDDVALEIPVQTLKEYSPAARLFPNVDTQQEVDVFQKILQHPPIAQEVEDSWRGVLYQELERNRDRDRFIESEEKGDYPVYQGRNIYQYCYDGEQVDDIELISLWSVDEEKGDKSAKARVRGKNFRSRNPHLSLKKAIYNQFSTDPEFSHLNTRSQKGFVNELLTEEFGRPELSQEDVKLHCTEYRIVVREVASATNERTVIAAVIPQVA